MQIDLDKIQSKLQSRKPKAMETGYEPQLQHTEKMAEFWEWMTREFGHKWNFQGGVFDGPKLAKNFMVWCEKLQHFTEREWDRVFKRIEGDIKEYAKLGKTLFPPSPTEVVAYAESPVGAGMYKDFDRSTAVEDLTKKEERHELGKQQCSNLLDMFK